MSVNRTSFVGIVADVKRDQENDYLCRKCCVYAISEDEFQAISKEASVNPRKFDTMANRFVVHCNPWKVMRILGELGYYLPVTPLGGRVDSATGERRTCIWTLQRSSGPPIVNHDS